jgi:hypothetical protein
MGTDYLQLLDRRTAEVIIGGNEADLAALVDLRTTPDGPPVWQSHWDDEKQALADFDLGCTTAQRIRTLIEGGSTLPDIKEELLQCLCVGGALLYLDYWGCFAEVFSAQTPPAAITWEEFTAPLRDNGVQKDEFSGCYLLTSENVASIVRSLDAHRHELKIMKESHTDHLRSWQAFCLKRRDFCVLYQIDF